MDAIDLERWMEAVGVNTYRDAAKLIGIMPDRFARFAKGEQPIPQYIALACAAVAGHIGPWPDQKRIARGKPSPSFKPLRNRLRAFIQSAERMEKVLADL